MSDHQIVYYRSRRLACYHVDRYQEHVSSQIGKSRVSRKNSLCRARKNTLTHVHFAPGKIDELFHGLYALFRSLLTLFTNDVYKKIALHAIIFEATKGSADDISTRGVMTGDPRDFNL